MKRVCLLVLVLAGCPQYGIVDFSVDKHTACPNDTVTVTWKVKGHARLAIIKGTTTPQPKDIAAASFQDVDSTKSQPFQVAEATTFVIRATDADQAKDKWQGTQPVDVPTADEPQLVTTTCTDQSCTGTFTVQTGAQAQVVRISDPMMKQGGKLAPTTIKLTHGPLTAVPLAPGQEITTPVPAAGDWTLEVPSSDPPPGLQITVRIACP